jgi:hypothetical protein
MKKCRIAKTSNPRDWRFGYHKHHVVPNHHHDGSLPQLFNAKRYIMANESYEI